MTHHVTKQDSEDMHALRDALDRLGYDRAFRAIGDAVRPAIHGDRVHLNISVEALKTALSGIPDHEARYLSAIRSGSSPEPNHSEIPNSSPEPLGGDAQIDENSQNMAENCDERVVLKSPVKDMGEMARELLARECGYGPSPYANVERKAALRAIEAALTSPSPETEGVLSPVVVEALRRLKAAGHSVLSAMDDYNAEHGTHIGGSAFFEIGRAIHQADQAIALLPGHSA